MRARKVPVPKSLPIMVRKAPGSASRALVGIGRLHFPAAIGKAGRSAFKREGDGATPIAPMRLLGGHWRADRIARPVTALPMTPIAADMLWCDAPGHALYNRRARSPLAASHERMMREDHLYDICLVMDWNVVSRRQGRGSAIFFHLARPGFAPTEGCIAVRLADMRRLLALVKKGTTVRVL